MVLQHHERLDGSGYPDRLQGDEIGLLTRIAMVADSYEAMIARRPYKKSLSRADALARLRQEVENGCLDGKIVKHLAQVTESWDPMEIHHDFHDDSTRELELFRKKTYFKEPLSDLYNYRYLFYLEEVGLLESHGQGYTLTRITFTNLERINKEHGYLVSDQIIDEVGATLFETIEALRETEAADCVNILLRKGTTYLIYSNCPQTVLDTLSHEFNACFERLAQEWHGVTACCTMNFANHHPIQDAVYQILDQV